MAPNETHHNRGDPANNPENLLDSLLDLIKFAKQFSPFYLSAYRDIDLESSEFRWTSVPVVEHNKFWSGEHEVATGPHMDGVILRTGGTTSKPKFTAYSHTELQRVGALLGNGLCFAGLKVGDKVANLFYAGECYASFLLHVLSVAAAPLPAIQVPIGGLTPIESISNLLSECECTVVLSTVTNLVKLSQHCQLGGKTFPRVHTIMFAGEPFFKDQQDIVRNIFPSAKIRSCIFGSIDSGVLAYSAGTDDARLFKTIPGAALIEICPDEHCMEATEKAGVEGSLVATNLLRRLVPVIRYPVGDRAEWVDFENGLFRLLGRDQHSVRIGPVSIDFDHLEMIVTDALDGVSIVAFQVSITRPNDQDRLTLHVDAGPLEKALMTEKIRKRLYHERPMFAEAAYLGHIEHLAVEFTTVSSMQSSLASGKLKRVVDARETNGMLKSIPFRDAASCLLKKD